MAGRSPERYELSRTFRLRFTVGFPDSRAGLPAFCVGPIRFRIPTEGGGGREDPCQHADDLFQRRRPETDPFSSVAKALSWAKELDLNPRLKRADIARREGISRARVTQLLQLATRGSKFWDDFKCSGKDFSLRDLLSLAKG